jgi:MFS family permease
MGIIGALFGGYGAAIYWVSQGGYLIKLFKKYNIPQNEEGKYFGIANGIVYGSSLFGALVTTFGLGYFGNTVYFTVLSVLTVISLLVCTFFMDGLKDVEKVDSLLSEQEVPLKNIKSDSIFRMTKDTFVKTMKYYPKMYYLVLPVILDGIISGFISIYLNKLIA